MFTNSVMFSDIRIASATSCKCSTPVDTVLRSGTLGMVSLAGFRVVGLANHIGVVINGL